MARDVQPKVRIDAWTRPVDADSVEAFLDGVDVGIAGSEVLKRLVLAAPRGLLFDAYRSSPDRGQVYRHDATAGHWLQ